LESAYEQALAHEFSLRGIPFERQKPLALHYKGTRLDCGFRLDFLVADSVVVEVKAIDALLPIHQAQLLSYLKLGGWKLGLLMNFHALLLRDGHQARRARIGGGSKIHRLPNLNTLRLRVSAVRSLWLRPEGPRCVLYRISVSERIKIYFTLTMFMR
jgi:GxxExxY protein